jgi:hypothetical protein
MVKECSSERYFERLYVLPPAVWLGKGFLVGEPHDHRRCKITNQVMPTYAAFFNAFGKFYEGDPMTVKEFEAFKVEDLP